MKEKGNYIMYARATSGDKLNNNKFSVCSVNNITNVLQKKRNNCFVGASSALGSRGRPAAAAPPLRRNSFFCFQSPASPSAGTGWWSRGRSATADTATSAGTSVAMTPTSPTTRSAS